MTLSVCTRFEPQGPAHLGLDPRALQGSGLKGLKCFRFEELVGLGAQAPNPKLLDLEPRSSRKRKAKLCALSLSLQRAEAPAQGALLALPENAGWELMSELGKRTGPKCSAPLSFPRTLRSARRILRRRELCKATSWHPMAELGCVLYTLPGLRRPKALIGAALRG